MNVHSRKVLEGVLALDKFKLATPRTRKVVENVKTTANESLLLSIETVISEMTKEFTTCLFYCFQLFSEIELSMYDTLKENFNCKKKSTAQSLRFLKNKSYVMSHSFIFNK